MTQQEKEERKKKKNNNPDALCTYHTTTIMVIKYLNSLLFTIKSLVIKEYKLLFYCHAFGLVTWFE